MSIDPQQIQVFPASDERWPDLEALFGIHRTSCWCTFWRIKRSEFSRLKGEEKKALLKEWTTLPIAPGVLAYDGSKAVGWCAVQPREKFLPLATSQTLKPVDDRSVWSIVCYFVEKSARRQGVMQALLRGAIEYARQNGATIVEGYPIDMRTPPLEGKKLTGYSGFMGIASVYRQVGFVEVGRASETQLIMRYQIV
jgi:GNAT superfamily N-acetyltransferase